MRTIRLLGVAALLFGMGSVAAGPCGPETGHEPHTLILALDGVPYRDVQAARELGAFRGWGETRPMVAPFPSMTNVSFTAILGPFGASAIPGYETRLYDPEDNRIEGGDDVKAEFDWRKQFQIQLAGFWAKAGLYLTPKKSTLREMEHVREFVLQRSDPLRLALISSTDSLTHFHGDHATIPMLLWMSDQIEDMRERYLERYGHPLNLVMLSDHGNAPPKVRRPDGTRKVLREAGLRPAKRLDGPDDVITVTYGVVGYGALYLDPVQAETAARAMLLQTGVHLAAWKKGKNELAIVSANGEAEILWRGDSPKRAYRYHPDRGDPLQLSGIVKDMRDAGVFDEDGYASRESWFEWTARAEFPDAVARLAESLNGAWVQNSATVIFSYDPGYAWGLKKAQVGAWLKAGRLEATHGGLDRESTWGFFMTSDPDVATPPAVRADRALVPWARLRDCSTVSVLRFEDPDDAELHGPRLVVP